jgi:hypothetical protein
MVIRINDFLLTLVMYSLFIIVEILFMVKGLNH